MDAIVRLAPLGAAREVGSLALDAPAAGPVLLAELALAGVQLPREVARSPEMVRMRMMEHVNAGGLARVRTTKVAGHECSVFASEALAALVGLELTPDDDCRVDGPQRGQPEEQGRAEGTDADAAGEVEFLRESLALKRQPRTGWVLRSVPRPESVADHSFGVALAALVMSGGPQEGGAPVDWTKAVLMGLVHDLAEALVGDYVPGQVTEARKHAEEASAMRKLLGHLGPRGEQTIGALWREYERRESPEALLVKDLDRIEMLIQAEVYEQIKPAGSDQWDLEEFFEGVRGKIRHPRVCRWHAYLEAQRAARRAAGSGTAADSVPPNAPGAAAAARPAGSAATLN